MPKFADKHLTERTVATLKPQPGKVVERTDGAARGLTIRVTPEGTRTWAVRYSVRGVGQRKATIGRYPAVSLAEARRKAQDVAAAAQQGIDAPAAERAQAAQQRTLEGNPVTVADLIGRWVDDYAKRQLRRWQVTEAALVNHAVPKLGKVKLTELRRADVVELVDHLRNDKGLTTQADNIRGLLIGVLNWGVEREFIASNPAITIKPAKGGRRSRDRILSDDELRQVWMAAERIGYPGGHFIRALLLTGQRKDEVRCLPWTEIKADGWHLPASRNKSKRNHHLPLSDQVLALLADCRRCAPAGDLVFSHDGKRPYSGSWKFKTSFDAKCGVGDWTLHDIRRTVRTRLTEMHVHDDVARAIVNHAKQGLDKVYNRAQHQGAMRDALQAWADRVDRIVAGVPNVVQMVRSA